MPVGQVRHTHNKIYWKLSIIYVNFIIWKFWDLRRLINFFHSWLKVWIPMIYLYQDCCCHIIVVGDSFLLNGFYRKRRFCGWTFQTRWICVESPRGPPAVLCVLGDLPLFLSKLHTLKVSPQDPDGGGRGRCGFINVCRDFTVAGFGLCVKLRQS